MSAPQLGNQSLIFAMRVLKFVRQTLVKRIIGRHGRRACDIRQQGPMSGVHLLPGSLGLFSGGHANYLGAFVLVHRARAALRAEAFRCSAFRAFFRRLPPSLPAFLNISLTSSGSFIVSR